MPTLDQIRSAAESSNFFFQRVVLGYRFFTLSLHRPMCMFMQSASRRRKLMIVPRDCAKTTIMKGTALHMLIQPPTANLYFPGRAGVDLRMIIAGETIKNSGRHLLNIEHTIDTNKLFQSLWPHIKKSGRLWSSEQMLLQRSTNYSEPTIEALGVDSAIASRHVDVIFKDDIFTFAASQSTAIAETVRMWNASTEAVLDEDENSTAFDIFTGTPWSELDIYKPLIDEYRADGETAEYDVYMRSIIESGESIWPERFSLERLGFIRRRLDRDFPGLWELNYMTEYGSSAMTDLRRDWLKRFEIDGSLIRVA